MSTSFDGCASRSFISGSRLMPPAITLASPPDSAESASSSEAARW